MKKTRLKLLLATGLATLGLNLTPQLASAITTSGVMPGNETWSGTVTLTGDVTVPANVTLTILPGTVVQSWDNYDDTAGGTNPNRIELIINGGRLSSVGTSNNPIRFTSSPLNPPAKRGDWYGIRFLNATNTSSVLNWAIIEYGTKGASVESGNVPTIDTTTFRYQLESGFYDAIPAPLNNCLFTSNGMACDGSALVLTNCVLRDNGGWTFCQGGGCSSEAAIRGGSVIVVDCVFTNNSGTAINAEGKTVTALRTMFVKNSGWAVYAGTPRVSDCTITNGGGGVYNAFADATVEVLRCKIVNLQGTGVEGRYVSIRDTTIENVSGSPVFTGDWGGGPSSLLVSNCVIRGGAPYGIRHGGGNATILNSVIAYNSGEGIYANMPTVRGCSIDHNAIGLRLAAPTGTTASGIVSNRITANTSYEVQNDGPGAVLITNNFWGEPTTTELANNVRNLTKIYDSQDNASVGQVLLKPYLPSDPFAVPPKITSEPADLTVAAGTTATFTVTATSATPMTYQWRKGTTNLSGQTNSFLTFTAQLSDAATNYNVVVSNNEGSTNSRWATLTVLVPPSITGQPTNLFLPAGSTAAFHVTATGSEPLSYRWQKGGVNLGNNARVSGATTPDLTITSIQASDAADYRCVVTNAVGTAISSNANLSLPTPPSLIQQPVTQVVSAGAPATFTVTAEGSTPLHYQWYLNGSAISDATGESLNLPTTTAAWLGSYQVQVWNIAGTNWSATAGLWLDALKMYAGVNVYGPAGSNCVVQYTTNLTEPVSWAPLQSVTIVTNPTVIIDYDSPEQAKRFYRTVPQ
ncbi:MAG TPA: immunoglobulin domain-containing protein [Verrucomicrobiae bacterium]